MFRSVVRYGRLRHLAELSPEEPVPEPTLHGRGVEVGTVLALATGPESPRPREFVRTALRIARASRGARCGHARF